MYRQRLDAVAAVWQRWAEVGGGLTDAEWSTPSRCAGWDVAALFAHVGPFAHAVLDPPQADDGDPVSAVDILRGFNAPSGVAHAMADQVADAAVTLAAQVGRRGLVAFFADAGPRGIAALRDRPADGLVLWPAAGVATWAEALRETAHLLVDLADPVAFIEAATGRSAMSPLPVLR